MRGYWATGRKGALVEAAQPTPLDDGRYCRVIDLENGEIPVPTYGRTPDEVLEKIERTGMHARLRLTGSQSPTRQPAQAQSIPAQRRLSLTADEQMLATTRLADPQAAPQAVRQLFEAATGIDTAALAARAFQERAEAWEARHPELKNSFFNKKLIVDNARMRVQGGDVSLITAEVLEACYQELSSGGFLLTEDDLQPNPNPKTLPVPSGESPNGGTRQTAAPFATGHRLNRTGSVQVPQWQPKYTREQIDRMPLAQSEKLLRSRDKDYADAVNHWYPPRQVAAQA
jgi:hypothetical protein